VNIPDGYADRFCACVAIDGSEFKAVNNWDKDFTSAKVVRAGPAIAAPERVDIGTQAIEVVRVRITEAGRKALSR
jgi:hypothetical protein